MLSPEQIIKSKKINQIRQHSLQAGPHLFSPTSKWNAHGKASLSASGIRVWMGIRSLNLPSDACGAHAPLCGIFDFISVNAARCVSLIKTKSPPKPGAQLPEKKIQKQFKRGMHFWKRASLTVECALILPLFFLGMVTLICYMDAIGLQAKKLSQVCQQAKEAGMYAYTLDSYAQEEITIPTVYTYKPPISLIPLRNCLMTNQAKVHAWIGSSGRRTETGESEQTEEMVYVTSSGSVYHTDEHCTYLDLTVHQVSGLAVGKKRNTYGEKYHACEVCSGSQQPGGLVYITDTGNRYHNSPGCRGLKRQVRLVKRSSLPQLHQCSRCAKKTGG